jgi:V/A-type H+-transporting ATPase subunit C
MSKKGRQTPENYLAATGRVRMLETRLLGGERLSRMIELSGLSDAYKVLSECGYELGENVGKSGTAGIYELSDIINAERARVFDLISGICPTPEVIEFFRIKSDYHNYRTLLKAEAAGTDATPYLISSGRTSINDLTDIFLHGGFDRLPDPAASKAVAAAKEILARSKDGQLADFELDRAMVGEMLKVAEASGFVFLIGYARLYADTVNLRAAVRLAGAEDGRELLKSALVDGGNVSAKDILSCLQNKNSLSELSARSPLAPAIKKGEDALQKGNGFSEFEAACDKALAEYFSPVKYMAYGAEIPFAYLAAKENEYRVVRTVISGKISGAGPEAIRARLRV